MTERNGSELIVRSDVDGRQYRRNVAHTKLLPDTDRVGDASVGDGHAVGPVAEEPAGAIDPVGRPKRTVVKPARYN